MTDEIIPWLERFGPERQSIAGEREELKKLHAETTRTFGIYKALIADGVGEAEADKRSRCIGACRTMARARSDARKAFAVDRGWVVGPAFDLPQLRGRHLRDCLPIEWRSDGCLQDAEFFWTRNERPAAILAHERRSGNTVLRFAEREGLRVEELEYSWLRPGERAAVLYQKTP